MEAEVVEEERRATVGSMAGYHLSFRISCPRPTADALAFLGPMKATAAYNANRLAVDLEVEAKDVVEALTKGKDLVLDRLPGDVEIATVTAVDGLFLPSGRLFRRRRNR